MRVGDVVTTEVPGLAEALRRPAVHVKAELRLTDGSKLDTNLVLADAIGILAMKTLVRAVRTETRDAEDLWRCLEIAAADGAGPSDFDDDPSLRNVRDVLWRELGPRGPAAAQLSSTLQPEPSARLRTRVRVLLTEVVGEIPAP